MWLHVFIPPDLNLRNVSQIVYSNFEQLFLHRRNEIVYLYHRVETIKRFQKTNIPIKSIYEALNAMYTLDTRLIHRHT